MADFLSELGADRCAFETWTFVHEVGHALKFKDPKICGTIQSISIVGDDAAGTAGHLNWLCDIEDLATLDDDTLFARLVMVLAGPMASSVVLDWDEPLSGKDKDDAARYAAQLAKNGLRARSERQIQTQQSIHAQWAEAVAPEVQPQSAEVEEVLSKARTAARVLIESNLRDLRALAKALLERKELSGDEVRAIFETGSLPAPDPLGKVS